jgi:hemoglobin
MNALDITSETQLTDIRTEENIQLMVNAFYQNVRQDGILEPVFSELIDDWEAHLPIMYRFWEKLLFGKDGYKRNPFQKHVNLPVSKEHFTRWIELFTQSIDANFIGPKADEAKRLATNIANSFQERMGLTPEGVTYVPQRYSRN